MKRLYSIIRVAAIAAVLGSAMVSCEQEPTSSVAKAVLGDVTLMNFSASNPAAQTVTVYSDGDWHTTAPEWITVDPSTGNGVTTVTVTAANNTDSQGMLEPRKDTLIISGNTLASRLLIFVSQEGDAYRNAQHLTLDKVAELADGKAFILDEATVVAVTSAGFVLNSGTTNVYIQSTESVKVGDVVSVKAVKGSPADEVTVKSSGTYTYPTPINLNEVIATYTGETMDYVTVAGVVSGGNLALTVDEVDYSIKQVDCPADLKLSNYNGHKVELSGYTCGLIGAKQFGILTTDVKDKGLDQLIYFEDDFEWLAPWTAEGVGDDVTANSVNTDTAPNIFTNAEKYAAMIQEFQSRGYSYIWGWKGQDWSDGTPDNGNKSTLYIQKNYLKFGKTKYSSGIILPALKTIDGTADVTLSFDWCYCMTGGNKPDLTTITAVLTGGGTFASSGTETSDEISSGQVVKEDGTTSLAWQHVELNITGATSSTRITIRPTNTDPDVTNSERHQNRWYLDNIKVLPSEGGSGGGGGIPAGTTVFEENFEWLEPYATAANAPDDVTNNSVGSSPNIFTNAALQPILVDLQTKGYGFIWGGKNLEWSTAVPETGNGQTLYLQKNYLKFGKSDYSSGIILPALTALTSTANVELTFDWCWCMTGKSKPDIMTLTAAVSGGESTELTSAQPTADDLTKLEWQHASVTINGATAETRITLRPTNSDPYVSNTARGQNRWYLDNIKIVTK